MKTQDFHNSGKQRLRIRDLPEKEFPVYSSCEAGERSRLRRASYEIFSCEPDGTGICKNPVKAVIVTNVVYDVEAEDSAFLSLDEDAVCLEELIADSVDWVIFCYRFSLVCGFRLAFPVNKDSLPNGSNYKFKISDDGGKILRSPKGQHVSSDKDWEDVTEYVVKNQVDSIKRSITSKNKNQKQ